MSGLVSHLSGLSAEAAVARHYAGSGRTIAASRWRGAGGEVDLIAREGARVVFIEVKKARTHAIAAERLGRRQIGRLIAAAEEFLGGEPRGSLTEMRFDVALVDAVGAIEVIENAIAA
ncbi:MAG: YraN family protein [Gemmobacter sp.]